MEDNLMDELSDHLLDPVQLPPINNIREQKVLCEEHNRELELICLDD
jgi:hypothetical protein